MAGQPLLRGVSFKLERRERMTIAGRNGAGKTTLLRMLAGETSIDRGELSVAKGVRIALHDQRPPRDRGMALRDYVLSGCVEELQIEARAGGAGGAHGGGRGRRCAAGALRACAGASGGARRLSVARSRDGDGARPGVRRRGPRAGAGHVLGRTADARVAGSGAGDGRGRAAAGRADEPSGHRVAGVAGADARRAGRGGRAGRARPLVPGGGGHGGAGARGGPLALLRGHVAPVAQGAGGARDRAGAGDRLPARGDRAHGAVHRALPLQGDEGAPGAVAREETGEDRAHRARSCGGQGPGLPVRCAGALGAGDLRADRRPRGDRRERVKRLADVRSRGKHGEPVTVPVLLLEHAELWLERGEHVSLVGPERLGQDDADRDARRAARAGGGKAEHGAQREGRLPLPARRRARRGRRRGAERARRDAARDRR